MLCGRSATVNFLFWKPVCINQIELCTQDTYNSVYVDTNPFCGVSRHVLFLL